MKSTGENSISLRRKIVVRLAVAFGLGLGLAAGARSAAAANRVATHVACVGDSITAGAGASSTQANYPSVLQTLLGSSVQVRNFGRSGATMLSVGDLPYQEQPEYTSGTTFVSGAGANAVVDVIIMLGTNDSKPQNWMSGGATRAQQFRTDTAALVDHYAELSTRPLVYLALPPRAFANSFGISGSVIHDQIVPILKEVAAAKGIPTIDIDTPTTNRTELFPDGVHPNDAGYRLLAETMRDGLLAPIGGGGGGAGGGGSGGMAGAAGAGGTMGGAAGVAGTAGASAPGGAGGRDAGGAGGGSGQSPTAGGGGDAGAGRGAGGTGPGGSNGTSGGSSGGTAGALGGGGIGGSVGNGGTAGSGNIGGIGGAPEPGGMSGGTNESDSTGCACSVWASHQAAPMRRSSGALSVLLMTGALLSRRLRRR